MAQIEMLLALKNAKKNKEGQKEGIENPEGSDEGATSGSATRHEVTPAISAQFPEPAPAQKPEVSTSKTNTTPKD